MKVIMAMVCVLLAIASSASAADVIADLDAVEGIEKLKAPPAAREMLQRNGFVVVPRFYHQIFSPYIQEYLPPFVTTDSLHRTFHVIFEEQIKKVEAGFAADVAQISKAMAGRMRNHLVREDRVRRPDDPAFLAEAYFVVAARLLNEEPPDPALQESVAEELKLIDAAGGVAPSPLFGYRIDYSQFKLRGFYTETPLLGRYFKAMTWYGNAAFRLISDRETRAAMLIAQTLALDKDIRNRWKKIDGIYTYLIAPPDDLTPLEYERPALFAMDASAEDPIVACKEQIRRLRDPKINSMVILPGDMPRWRELSKGMRFFGKRYIPDSEVFMNLCDPAVPGRYWPSGLDVMAVMGSARARELQERAGETKAKGYEDGFRKSCAMLDELTASEAPSHYVASLKLARTLLAPPAEEAPPFMKTAAYTDKNLMTALAAWTSLRHAWMLHAKQSVVYAGLTGPRPPGFVEPNFPFYDALHGLIRRTLKVLEPVEGVDEERLEELDKLVLEVAAIGRKQVKGEPLTKEEKRLLDHYGPRIAKLAYFEGNSYLSERSLPWMSLVADVHTEHLSAECLEEAVGAAMPIYVVVTYEGNQWLMVGGVYSYYEFRWPIADRLTDAKWRAMVEGGRLPPMPAWTSSFVAGYEVAAILDRIKKGESVAEARYVNAPSIEAFLEKAIAPGGDLDGKENLAWAVRLYGLKAGKKAVPVLMRYFVEEPPPPEESGAHTSPRCMGAANGLSFIADVDIIPALEEVALGQDSTKARRAVRIIGTVDDKEAERSLVRLLQRLPSERKRMAARELSRKGSRDITLPLLEVYPQAESSTRKTILVTVGYIWGGTPRGAPFMPRYPATLDEAAAAALRPKVNAFVLKAVREEEGDVRRSASNAAMFLKLEEAIPLIEHACAVEFSHSELRILERFASDAAVRALIRLSYVAEHETEPQRALAQVLWTLERLESPLAAPRLLTLLDRNEEVRDSSARICDYAARALGNSYPDGPKWRWKMDRAERDKVIADWKEFLGKRGVDPSEALTPEDRIRVARFLIESAGRDTKRDLPSHRIGKLGAAQTLVAGRSDGAALEIAKAVQERLAPLVRAEVEFLAEMTDAYAGDNQRKYPDPSLPLTQAFKNYYKFDPSRVSVNGDYCDPWGNPYGYSFRDREGKECVEIRSFGPNGKDENGQGDDIASWRAIE